MTDDLKRTIELLLKRFDDEGVQYVLVTDDGTQFTITKRAHQSVTCRLAVLLIKESS